MPPISLTDFVDVVSASGLTKATKVRYLKNRPEYNPAADYYKVIRDLIKEVHVSDLDKSRISVPINERIDPKKIENYRIIVEGYKKWWGRKILVWFEPPDALYTKHGVNVIINPELGLIINGTPYLVKLYFKANPLLKNKIDIITHLMSISLSDLSPESAIMSVLDIRQSKLISYNGPIDGLTGTLNAELSYIAALWSSM